MRPQPIPEAPAIDDDPALHRTADDVVADDAFSADFRHAERAPARPRELQRHTGRHRKIDGVQVLAGIT